MYKQNYFLIFVVAPSNSPSDVRAKASSSTSILVTWSEVPSIDQNGAINTYEIMYSQLNDRQEVVFTNITNTSASDLSVTLQYLQEFVNYNISVRAYTNVGPGPFSGTVMGLTFEDSKCVLVSFSSSSSFFIYIRKLKVLSLCSGNFRIFSSHCMFDTLTHCLSYILFLCL